MAPGAPSKWDWQAVTSQLQVKQEPNAQHPKVQQKSFPKSPISSQTLGHNQQTVMRKEPSTQQKRQEDTKSMHDMEVFSGLRIKQRAIPKEEIQEEMKDRRFVKLSQMEQLPKDFFMDQETDWVTIGVLVRKTFSKSGAKGDFIVWTLSDLERTELGIFLFSEAYESHKRMQEGSIVALLNATLMTSNERTGFAFKVSRGQEIVKLGHALDFGICKGMASTNARCKLAVNTSKSHFCLHHIASKFLSVGKNRLQLNHAFNFSSKLFDDSKKPKNLSTGSYAPIRTASKKRKLSNIGNNNSSRGVLGVPTIVSQQGDVSFQMAKQDVANPISSQQARLPKALVLDELKDKAKAGDKENNSISLNPPPPNPKSRGHRLVASFLGASSAAKKPKRVDMIRFMNTGSTKQ